MPRAESGDRGDKPDLNCERTRRRRVPLKTRATAASNCPSLARQHRALELMQRSRLAIAATPNIDHAEEGPAPAGPNWTRSSVNLGSPEACRPTTRGVRLAPTWCWNGAEPGDAPDARVSAPSPTPDMTRPSDHLSRLTWRFESDA
jgi:hypothetical protein